MVNDHRLAPAAVLAPDRPFAERAERTEPWADRALRWLADHGQGWLDRRLPWRQRRLARIVPLVLAHEAELRALDDAALRTRTAALRAQLRRDGVDDLQRLAAAFALVRETAGRVLGMRHHPCQMMAGLGLVQGCLVEMATGEGKTFAATLAAATLALAGHPVHVITVNDYLAGRDAADMAPLYRALGLTVAAIDHAMDRPARRAAYGRDITYCSNKELAFDYLRDRTAPQGRRSALHQAWGRLRDGAEAGDADAPLVLRGLAFAIVDEADSVFIDEARTPLILSASREQADDAGPCLEMLALARRLVPGVDCEPDLLARTVRLTDAGRAQLESHARGLGGWWTSVRGREEKLLQALSALLLFQRDRHYLVADDAIVIVDESTGRAMPDRAWQRGLQQFIEAKEGVPLTPPRETLARITYQRLMRRYLRLSGMTGTATEVAGEIRRVYGLPVARVPLHRPSRLVRLPTAGLPDQTAKWQAVLDIVRRVALGEGRPVLIGTRSVQASETLSGLLHEAGIEHALLNARQDQDEAALIARAGEAGRVTVATNMAGRGTDIRLGAGVAERGGLHVVLTEFHGSARVDRQLIGRCARQHDPGSAQAVVAVDDELFTSCMPRLAARLARRAVVPSWQIEALRRLAQQQAESRDAQLRLRTMAQDRQLQRLLAFSGVGE